MSGVYSMNGPTYSPLSKADLLDSALSQPLSLTSTLYEEGKGGALESFGLGTVLRQSQVPLPAPSEEAPYGFDPEGLDVPAGISPQDYLQGNWVTPDMIAKKRQEMGALTEDQYKQSPSYRKDIPYDPGMTETRAAALAAMDDARKVRELYAQKRPLAAFLGSMAGQALDPINYIPVGGPMVKGAAIARFGRIGGEALTAGLDAAANTALFGVGTARVRAQFGDDVSWQALVSQIATAGLIGSAFGTVAGAIGRRMDIRVAEAEQRLATLQTTQEARIALNEGIDAIIRGEDVNLSPNATEPISRAAGEVSDLSRAYDEVRANPTGSARDPLVSITPDDIEGTIVARGAFGTVNEADVSSKRGWGLVKIIWGHGENSPEEAPYRISKEDVTDLPNVVRRFEPSSVSADGTQREWRVERDGRTVVYADSLMPEGRHVVTAYVQRPDRAGAEALLSKERPAAAGSLSEAGNPLQDTDQALNPRVTGGQPQLPATQNIAQKVAVDNSKAAPEPLPAGHAKAQASIAKPEDARALAAQYGVDASTGAFKEEAEITQLADEGRLTEQDVATMAQAHMDYEVADAYAEALKSVAGCLI
ncbi:hypothetical protein [Mesorhizobium sp.]|uniref:hypothetical protein n=1 Tax=Mesorhizobium sp. TaxID=1871066 RepID=UPI000FE5DA26|nr:hypothetical protein [Mesorhizobium sp.]RWG26408.1 MAG: hypothetical protein EOQ60_27520 [Mesorhizobium sp.]